MSLILFINSFDIREIREEGKYCDCPQLIGSNVKLRSEVIREKKMGVSLISMLLPFTTAKERGDEISGDDSYGKKD